MGNDIRMGPVVHGGKTLIKCSTDNLDNENCPGYFGHIKLTCPVFHIFFVRTMIHILSCVSYWDSTLLIDNVTKCRIAAEPSLLKGQRRLQRLLYESRGIKRCPRSGYPQPIYRLSIT